MFSGTAAFSQKFVDALRNVGREAGGIDASRLEEFLASTSRLDNDFETPGTDQ